jgi:hypothetical protein
MKKMESLYEKVIRFVNTEGFRVHKISRLLKISKWAVYSKIYKANLEGKIDRCVLKRYRDMSALPIHRMI